MKVLITSPYAYGYVGDWQKEFPQVEFITGGTPEEIVQCAGEADAAFGHVSREVFLAAPQLRWIQSGSAGVEWMRQTPELVESDVVVTNMRGAHASTIAEHAFGML